MIYIVQPYYFWQGHFAPYFNNLITDEAGYEFVYCAEKDQNIRNSKYIACYKNDYDNSFVAKMKARIINNYKTVKYLSKTVKKNDTIHLIEYEPFSLFYLYLKLRRVEVKFVQTIHSIERIKFNNKLKNLISSLQRKMYRLTLRKFNKLGRSQFVVHYPFHKQQLAQIVSSDSIKLIHYPCPAPKSQHVATMSGRRLLIFGIIREDKGIYEFLETVKDQDLELTIAGKIQDERVRKFQDHRKIKFIDKYLNQKEIDDLFFSHDFLILPYGNKYTGGAGPLKDSFSYGKPVISSDHDVFKDIISQYNCGVIANSFENLAELISKITPEQYAEMSQNGLNFSQNYNWEYMKQEYYKLYANAKE